MPRMRDQYVIELADTVIELFSEGNADPSDDEVAARHFPDRTLGNEIVEGLRKRLGKIRDVLVQDHSLPVYLVNERYYRRYKVTGTLPETETEARRCLPGGAKNPTAGLRLRLDGDADLIWQAMLAQGVDAGGGRVRAALDRALDAVEEDRFSDRRAIEIMQRAREKSQPQHTDTAERLAERARQRAQIEDGNGPETIED